MKSAIFATCWILVGAAIATTVTSLAQTAEEGKKPATGGFLASVAGVMVERFDRLEKGTDVFAARVDQRFDELDSAIRNECGRPRP